MERTRLLAPFLLLTLLAPAAEAQAGPMAGDIHGAVNVSLGRSYDVLSESFEEKHDRWLLFADGQVYDDLPSGPLGAFDAAEAKRKRPKGWGTWKIKGGTLEVVWNGSTDRRPSIYRDWFRLDVPKRGAKLNGVYSKVGFVQQNLGADTTFSASGWSTMAFERTGTFSHAKGGSTSYGSGAGGVHANSKSESDGTYTIDGPLLVMKHRDGTVFRASLFFVGANPKIIFVNGRQYLRR